MEPNTGAILALANWPRVNANALEDSPEYARTNRAVAVTYEPGSTFKAFTVAAALEDGKVTPRDEVRHPADAAGRRPRDHRRRGPRLRDDSTLRHPQGVLEHRRGPDRAAGQDDAVRRLDPQVGLRQADRRRPAGRGARARAAARGLLGRDHGQPADRPGHRGHADADGGRLRRDRQRRHPAPAAHRRLRRRPQDAAAQGQARDLRGHRGLGAQDARGRASAPAAPPPAPRSRATTWPARPARPRRRSTASTPRTSTSRRSSASRPPTSRSCWSRSSSTSPTARSTAARSPRRPGARSSTSHWVT